MDIDTAMAARFLSALTGDRDFTFQTFGEAPTTSRSLNRVLHGPFSKNAKILASLNSQGAGVFAMVNRGDLCGRKASNVIGARALFLDLDGAPIEPVLASALKPRIVVESSPGKWHCYWPVADLPLDRFSAAQKALAARFGGDPKVHDRSRVMRLPGFLHHKGTPWLTRLEVCDPIPCTWDEVCREFELEARWSLPGAIPEGERNSTLYRLAKSAFLKGVPEEAQAAKALKVNAARCTPPLPDEEVLGIVASAYQCAPSASVSLPVALLDSDAYSTLSDAGRTLLTVAYRRADRFNEGALTLPWSELSRWFPREETYYQVRRQVIASGLLVVTKDATPSQPKNRRGPKPTFYRLAIPHTKPTYFDPEIPPESVGPEALQGDTDEAL